MGFGSGGREGERVRLRERVRVRERKRGRARVRVQKARHTISPDASLAAMSCTANIATVTSKYIQDKCGTLGRNVLQLNTQGYRLGAWGVGGSW